MYLHGITVARSIESCSRCPHLVFPGEDIVQTDDGPAHASHFPAKTVIEPLEPVYV